MMYLGEQLSDPSDERLTLSAQLGVTHVALHGVPHNSGVAREGGEWDAVALRHLKEGYAREFGLTLDVLGLDAEQIWSQLVTGESKAERTLERIVQNIRAAGEAGIRVLKYRIQPLGVTRTGRTKGRGEASYSTFRLTDWSDDSQTAAGTVSEARMWMAIELFLREVVPVAEKSGVRLACHPQDAPLPPVGLRGWPHVLSSVDALERFLRIHKSPMHGLNFCQGTVAEMCNDPKTEVIEAIERFAGMGKVFMVHFRNIKGGFGDFVEVYPDNGDVDMLQAMRAYKEAGLDGMLCPDHVPHSAVDPTGEKQFAFCLGYTRALMQAADTSDT
jgi:mannonate dehydratase